MSAPRIYFADINDPDETGSEGSVFCHVVLADEYDQLRTELAGAKEANEKLTSERDWTLKWGLRLDAELAAASEQMRDVTAERYEEQVELSALKAGQGGAVAYIPVDRKTGEQWEPRKHKGSGLMCDYIPLYTAPPAAVEAELERLRKSVEALLSLDVRGHQLRDRLQFSDQGRAILELCKP